ncbi:MAG: peptidoglycan DD-metalloendopeptidase family protein [Acidobacteriota bacterium]
MKKFIFLILLIPLILIPSKEEKLKKLNEEIKKIKQNIDALGKEKGSLLNELYKIELIYKKASKENNRIRIKMNRTKRKIRKKNLEKVELETSIKNSKGKIKKVVRILYKIGKTGNFKIFFNIKNLNQLFKNYYLFLSIVNYKLEEIEKIKVFLKKLEIIKSELEKEYKDLKKLKRNEEKKLAEILSHKKNKLTFINKVNSNKNKYMGLLKELNEEAKKLTALIEKRSYKVDLPDLNLGSIKGTLRWPLKGSVISSFGRKKSTRFNTYILNNGIEIRPGGSLEIRAVYSGVIIFRNYFKGYGNIIIVQHSKDFMTIYGHCETFLKNKDDFVKAGEKIGIAGDSGSTLGISLYFEVRKGTKAVNPIPWLKKNR